MQSQSKLQIQQGKERVKSFIGKRVLRDGNERGVITGIGFNNKDYTICWFFFKSERGGEFLVSIKSIESLNKQLELF